MPNLLPQPTSSPTHSPTKCEEVKIDANNCDLCNEALEDLRQENEKLRRENEELRSSSVATKVSHSWCLCLSTLCHTWRSLVADTTS